MTIVPTKPAKGRHKVRVEHQTVLHFSHWPFIAVLCQKLAKIPTILPQEKFNPGS